LPGMAPARDHQSLPESVPFQLVEAHDSFGARRFTVHLAAG